MYVYYTIATLSILLFLHGFFPIPPRSAPKKYDSHFTQFQSKHDKAVLVVIDALRLDFISAQLTPFVWQTYRNTGCYNILKVESPTVTLPRIKALTTGTVPQFIDIIFNLANPAKVDDSFVHRAKANGKKIVFYGDDIWLRLFPKEFERSEGTTSFFVNDFTQVDDNVTRNVRDELKRSDWDIMILHYLGLDHIGHVYGPKSSLVLPKLNEMDNIIQEIYNHTSETTLIFITGDHGMRDSGGHGGSTFSETHVPLIVLRMSCSNATFTQIDIPANLGVLLNFQIPSSSIGQLQPSLLQGLPFEDVLNALKYNTDLLVEKLNLCQEDLSVASYLYKMFLKNSKKESGEQAAKIYKNCSRIIAERLLRTSVQQNINSLIIASIMILYVMVKILQTLHHYPVNRLEQSLMIGIIAAQFSISHHKISIMLIMSTLGIFLYNLTKIGSILRRNIKWNFWIFLTLIHPFSLLSSSFLEEEHQFWYFILATYFASRYFKEEYNVIWSSFAMALRFIKTINQVGDKWASAPDLADWFLQTENKDYFDLFFAFSLFLVFTHQLLLENRRSSTIDVVVLVGIFVYRVFSNNFALLAQHLWFLIFVKFILSRTLRRVSFVYVFILIIALLMKPYNIVIIPFCCAVSNVCKAMLTVPKELVIVHWWLSNLLYFAQGHDNSLASIDIASGYVGLREYHPWLVIPQVFCHTYALPILTNLLLFQNNYFSPSKGLSLFVILRLYVIIVVFFAMFIQRNHLFIWSVFAPKLIIEAGHFGCLFIQITCYNVYRQFNKFLRF